MIKDKSIGSRLLMAASFIENGDTVCDVGCDHGKLALHLIKENKAKKIYATDINKMPLQKAIELFKENSISDRAEFYLTDGLKDIKNTENISHIVIAGLGGNTMADVINAAPFIKKQKTSLVLLPAQSASKIREYLYLNGFSIKEEKTVCENNKFYSCISAVYTKDVKTFSVYDLFIGKIDYKNTQSDIGYFKMVLSQLEKMQKGCIIREGREDEDMQSAILKIKNLLSE